MRVVAKSCTTVAGKPKNKTAAKKEKDKMRAKIKKKLKKLQRKGKQMFSIIWS